VIQFDLGGKFKILGGDSVGHREKKFHINICLILTVYREGAV
jgi:hypothetical protein